MLFQEGCFSGFRFSLVRAACILAAVAIGSAVLSAAHAQTSASSPASPIWTVPEVGALPNDAFGSQVRRGRDLITATYAHIGPEVSDPAKRFAGNNLACTNCHLEAGTQEVRIADLRSLPAVSAIQRPARC